MLKKPILDEVINFAVRAHKRGVRPIAIVCSDLDEMDYLVEREGKILGSRYNLCIVSVAQRTGFSEYKMIITLPGWKKNYSKNGLDLIYKQLDKLEEIS